jgi:hypothetical protein
MDNFTAVQIVEGLEGDVDEKRYLEAWQHLVDTGLAWQLQSSFGREGQYLIDQGLIEER